MKNIILAACAGLVLAACQTAPETETYAPKIGSPNPASKYCMDQGGKLEIRESAQGQTGYCHLSDGKVVEEWELFRSTLQKCQADKAQKLVGTSGLSDKQILENTQSEIIRRVGPNDPVTMDYRENRITIVVDPTTQKISSAKCG
jgi:uncharacterized protein